MECTDSGAAYCNCGVAVRMGRDVYVIDLCRAQPWFINYKHCEDRVIRVQSFGELKYKVKYNYSRSDLYLAYMFTST